jgi:hypothetical protein
VVEGESALQALARNLPGAEDGAGIVDQHIDTKLGNGDSGCYILCVLHQRKVGVVDGVSHMRSQTAKPAHRKLAARAVAGDLYDSRAFQRQILSRCPTYSGRGPVITTTLFVIQAESPDLILAGP